MSDEIEIRPCAGTTEWPRLVEVWRSAVEATHDFLTPDDVEYFESRLASDYLPQVDLTVATVAGEIVGFVGLADGGLEMLFVEDEHRGRGIGTLLLRDALARSATLRVDVNEQNERALGFYLRHGFHRVGRSATDQDGRPYPILHLEYREPPP
ncbi:putative acetyltransferase [Stackebrandtia endophytica]|uniref:Putative acetyltransferase n=1 Tax=Stackebrandtia endophytica TaxID=1496996 RepID=A0A543AUG7_9ACTN|nr:acetyltransferase [Stackebrandtia endophytica]TQL76197.1 putative acetyltransferase [Stackebrandtia endophytica]